MKGKQGFASMSPDRRREIASMGGKAAHTMGTAHQFNSEEARAAGKKGGRKRHQFTREEAQKAGRKGGSARAKAA